MFRNIIRDIDLICYSSEYSDAIIKSNIKFTDVKRLYVFVFDGKNIHKDMSMLIY